MATKNWADYSWYRLLPTNKKYFLVTDVKGHKYDLDYKTVYGALPVKTGVRLVDADNVKSFITVTDKMFAKMLKISSKLRKPPLIVAPPVSSKPSKVIIKPLAIDTTHIQNEDPSDSYTNDFEDEVVTTKPVAVDELERYNDIDDLSVELYGHHLHDFNDFDYSSLNSVELGQLPLGSTYENFIQNNKHAADARLDKDLAENMMVPIVKTLFYYLQDKGFKPSIVCGIGFTKDLAGCSSSIEKWTINNQSAEIKHLVIKVENTILDPCFKRLGDSIRIDNYPSMDFYRSWVSDALILDIESCPISDMQIPVPTYLPLGSVKAMPTRLSLKV